MVMLNLELTSQATNQLYFNHMTITILRRQFQI